MEDSKMSATGERSSHNDHTPGPWYCPGINSKYGVSDWKQANITTGSEYAPIIATVHTEASTYLGEIDHDTMLANARLIAAAPETAAERDQLRDVNADLLAALEWAVARIIVANHEGDPILSAWLPDARAAIEKARKEG